VYFGRRGVEAASQTEVRVFPRGALVSMLHCDVQVPSDVGHSRVSVDGQCRRSATWIRLILGWTKTELVLLLHGVGVTMEVGIHSCVGIC